MPGVLPVLVSLAALLALNLWPNGRMVVEPYLPALPWLVLGLGLALAWRFNRGRPALALCLLAAGAVPAGWLDLAGQVAHSRELFALLLPASLVVLVWLPERGLISLSGLLRTLGFAGLWATVFTAASFRPDAVRQILDWQPVSSLPFNVVLPSFILLLAWLLLGLLACYGLYRAGGPIEWALAFAALAGTVALYWSWQISPLTWFALVGLAPAIALVEMSHGLAFHDELTGLPGRRALNEALERIAGRYSLAMVDIDHFKQFNDRYGHDVGDQVLKMVAGRLAGVGAGGRAYRYGGEEFTLLFPGRSLATVEQEVDRIRVEVEQAGFILRRRYQRPRNKPAKPKKPREQRRLSVTVSMGVAERKKGEAADQVIKRADQALYRAKKAGRNRVVSA
ncbi:MAG: GGDEF domain-containing protein [Deltaproteobacteria bacterium]|nr:MAG: GGDEF domain-containing protein [Deltaproteobacteria bacterium]